MLAVVDFAIGELVWLVLLVGGSVCRFVVWLMDWLGHLWIHCMSCCLAAWLLDWFACYGSLANAVFVPSCRLLWLSADLCADLCAWLAGWLAVGLDCSVERLNN